MAKVLLVEDDPSARASTRKILEVSGYEVEEAVDGVDAQERLSRHLRSYDVVLSDIRMPRLSGIELFEWLRRQPYGTPMVLMTAFGRVEDAVRAMKSGAVDFLTKPFGLSALQQTMQAALKVAEERKQKAGREKSKEKEVTSLFWGESSIMNHLRAQVDFIASSDATVLIQGESGTGKERIARWIHEHSSQANGPWVPINCAAIPESLLESELFGHVRGAFTGADRDKRGLFEIASGGTLFLDEIGDMPLSAQTRLLRVLQEGEVRRLGSNETRKVQLRVIAATHQNLKKKVQEGVFREDLLFRLDVIRVTVPALRDHAEDILPLARFLLQTRLSREPLFDSSVERALTHYRWPGNVRELENAMERAAVFAGTAPIAQEHLPEHIRDNIEEEEGMDSPQVRIEMGTPLREVERILIERTLEATQGDKQETARLLGVNSRTIYRKLKEIQQKNESEADNTNDWEPPLPRDSIEVQD